MGMQRWAVFVHEPDGDMGEGVVYGPFESVEAAGVAAEKLMRAGGEGSPRDGAHGTYVEAIVLPVLPGRAGVAKVLDRVGYQVGV